MFCHMFVDCCKTNRPDYKKPGGVKPPFMYFVVNHENKNYHSALDLLCKELYLGSAIDADWIRTWNITFSYNNGYSLWDTWDFYRLEMSHHPWMRPALDWEPIQFMNHKQLISQPWLYIAKDSRKILHA